LFNLQTEYLLKTIYIIFLIVWPQDSGRMVG